MKTIRYLLKSRLRLAIALLFCFFHGNLDVHGLPANGSTRTAPERGVSTPGRSFTLSDIEIISNFGGSLMFNIPVGSLPPGRGGSNGALNLNYSSKIWDMQTLQVLESTITTHDKNTLHSSEEGNWRYMYGYKLKLDNKILGPEEGYCYGNNNPWKLQLVLPDGSEHALVLDGHTGEQGFMNVLPDGRSACPNNSYPVNITSTVTYFTTDGTYLRLDMLQDGDTPSPNDGPAWGSAWLNNTWILYSPDGSMVVGNPDPQNNPSITNRIYDRNANYIDVIEKASDPVFSNHRTTTLRDQLGRQIVVEYNAATDQDWVRSEGVAGNDVITKVKWKNIRVNKTYHACDYNPVGNPVDNLNYPLDETLRVVDQVFLPVQFGDPGSDDLYYTFAYNADNTSATDNGWGEVSRATMPSGAYADYSYFYNGVTGSSVYTEWLILNRPVAKVLHYNKEYDGSSTEEVETWTYATFPVNSALPSVESLTITGPDGGTYTEHYSFDSAAPGTSIPEHARGEVYKTVAADGSVTEKYYTSNVPLNIYQTFANRYVKYEFVSPKDASGNFTKTAIKEYKYDKNGNVIETREYDYVNYSTVPRNGSGKPTGLPSGATPARITKTEFYNDTPDAASGVYNDPDSYWLASSQRLRSLVKSTEVQDNSGTAKTRSEMMYDYTSYSSNTLGGNLTETKVWDSSKGAYSNPLTTANSISTSATYNQYGMPLTTTDANNVVTTITYGCIDGATGCSSTLQDLYPTKTEAASNHSELKRTSAAQYEFYTGLVTTATDVDNNVSVVTEYDALGRPLKVRSAYNTLLESWVQTTYDDVNRRVVVRSDIEQIGDGRKVATQFYDQLGRVRLAKTLEDAATQSPYNETDGIKVETRYQTGNPNSYQLTSNPFRAAYASQATNEATMGWTRSKAWNHGRHSEVETFSGAALPAPWGSNTTSTGKVQTDIDADRTLVTDQAGKQRISRTNALGQLKDVWEVTAADTATESLSFPNQTLSAAYRTSYNYDTLNNLTTVSQGVQTRNFAYNSLSRLTSATNPESGAINYGYDPNGNLTSKTDARGVKTDYIYDALNRVTNRNYSTPNGTPGTGILANYQPSPNVTYFYDGTNVAGGIANSKGKLTKVASAVSTTEYMAFDILGRVTRSKQTTDGVEYGGGTDPTKWMTYAYNLSGALIEQQYPSGRVVRNTLDTDGSLQQVQSKRNADAPVRMYANAFTYNAAGAVSAMRLGNGRWENTAFNSRLQPTQIGLGGSATNASLLKLNYDYGSTQNNGNVMSQTITVQTVGANAGFTAVQTYTYDSLNRLESATENIDGNQTPSWKQTYTFDRYGNRRFDTANTTTIPAGCAEAVCNPQIDANTNKLVGYQFDNAGNTKVDANGQSFTYDSENKQVAVTNGSGTVGEYFYDGDGKRVKKAVSNGESTVFVYDVGGKTIAEYSTVVEPTSTAKVSYLTNDHLGSPRITTDAVGQTISRRDFRPYGEEITRANYGSDPVRKRFTGYEKDDETNLNFAQARYQNTNVGRFSSPDPIFINLQMTNPQGWNKYVFVLNNPLLLIDPLGLIWGKSGQSVQWFDTEDLMKEAGYDAFTPLDWTYQAADGRWITLNPDGPGSCNAAYDCSISYFKKGWTESSDPSTWDRIGGHGVEDASLEFYSMVFGVLGIAKSGIQTLGGAVLRQTTIEGVELVGNGLVTKAAVEAAAIDKGAVVNVVSKLTQSPQVGRTLYVWEEATEATANQAIKAGQVYTAQIPKALLETLRTAGLVQSETTTMNGVTATALKFRAEASEFIVPFFTKVGGK